MTVCLNVPLCNGTQVLMMPRFEMKGFLDLLRRTRPNVLPAVPTLIQALAKVTERARALCDDPLMGDAAGWEWIRPDAGEPDPKSKRPAARVFNATGDTVAVVTGED